jgi:methionyl-tRNA formyltransferase
LALAHGLDVLQPERVKNKDFVQQLNGLKPDVIIVVAFGQILSPEILSLPPLGCINVHASLLPHYRGAAPINWAVINGETVTGVTTMFMDAGLDTGDMILKAELEIGPDDTAGVVHDGLMKLGAAVLSDTIDLLQQGRAPRLVQDSSLATYASRLTRETERIDWTQSATAIHNLVRGLNPWPGAYCVHQQQLLKIWQTKVIDKTNIGANPGEIIEIDADGVLVQTGKGVVELVEVQPECRKRMPARDCASGYGLIAGQILG